jgi:hypothetical protein
VYQRWLKDPKYPNQKVVIEKGALKKFHERTKKYFAYRRRTDEYRVKPPRGSKLSQWQKEDNSGQPVAKMFYSEKHMKKYKMDWMLDVDEKDEEQG